MLKATINPQYLISLNPSLRGHLTDPIEASRFWEKLGFKGCGDLVVIGDGHLAEKLLRDVLFNTLGFLAGHNHAKMLEQFIFNTYIESKRLGFSFGAQLTPSQIQQLQLPILWPVWLNNCIGATTCLSYDLHLPQAAFHQFLLKSSITAEIIDINVKGNLFISNLATIQVGQELGLKVGDNLMVFGQIAGGKQLIEVGGTFINSGAIHSVKDLIITASRAVIEGALNSNSNVSLKTINDVILQSLVGFAGISLSAIRAGGQINIDVRNINAFGAQIIGESVYIRALGGSITVVPLEIYNEVTRIGSDYYYRYQSLKLLPSTIQVLGSATPSPSLTKSPLASD